jgi:LmbE family N-acetylglucosaminyl deacetylase
MNNKPRKPPSVVTAATSLANAAKIRLPHQLFTYLDGLDASMDGRGFNADHQKAAEVVVEAVRFATIRRDALKQITTYPVINPGSPADVQSQFATAINAMQRLAKAALGSD